jgi:hypothetical protein
METLLLVANLGLFLFVAITILLGRKYLPSYVAKKAENLATKEDIATITAAVEDVKSRHAAALEQVKHELELTKVKFQSDIDRAALEHQIRFSWYHQRKAELIANVYALLNDVIEYTKQMVSPMQSGDDAARQEHAKATVELYNKLAAEYWGKKIFLEKDVCEKVERVVQTTRAAMIDFEISQDPQMKDTRLWAKAYKSMDKDIPPLMAELEEKFRTMLSNIGPAA